MSHPQNWVCLDRDLLLDRVRQWRKRRRTIGFTNGCFDILHPGHIGLLQEAARRAHRVIVAINDDASVSRLKGPGRPLIPVQDRAAVLAAIQFVDVVTVFSEDTPRDLIQEVRPDFLLKGQEYLLHEIIGSDVVRRWGGQVIRVPNTHSTTAILKRAKHLA